MCGRIIQNQSCVDNKYGSLIQFILFSLQMEDLKSAVYTISIPVLDFTFLQTKRQYLRLRKVQFQGDIFLGLPSHHIREPVTSLITNKLLVRESPICHSSQLRSKSKQRFQLGERLRFHPPFSEISYHLFSTEGSIPGSSCLFTMKVLVHSSPCFYTYLWSTINKNSERKIGVQPAD